MDGILSNDPARPAADDEIVTADDLALGFRERDEDLHDPRLKGQGTAIANKLSGRRKDLNVVEPEWLNLGEVDRESQSVRQLVQALLPATLARSITW